MLRPWATSILHDVRRTNPMRDEHATRPDFYSGGRYSRSRGKDDARRLPRSDRDGKAIRGPVQGPPRAGRCRSPQVTEKGSGSFTRLGIELRACVLGGTAQRFRGFRWHALGGRAVTNSRALVAVENCLPPPEIDLGRPDRLLIYIPGTSTHRSDLVTTPTRVEACYPGSTREKSLEFEVRPQAWGAHLFSSNR